MPRGSSFVGLGQWMICCKASDGFWAMKRYASIYCKEAKGISHGAVPALAARLAILLVIVLLAACNNDDGGNPPISLSSNADLVDLSFHGSLDQPFSAERFDYTATVAYRFKSIQVTPVTANENASVTINGSDVRSGFASSQIDLSVGQNAPILVEVTAKDAKASNTYRLVVTVEAPSTNADLAAIGPSLAVGAVFEGSNATGVNGDELNNLATNSGAVYLFTRDVNNQWSQQAYLKASNTDLGDQFGRSVALSGDTLAVGGYLEDSNATGVNGNQANNESIASRAVYVYQ